jgi:hypothetical protein
MRTTIFTVLLFTGFDVSGDTRTSGVTSVSALTTYLAALKSNTDTTPHIVSLALAFNTDYEQTSEIAWEDINAAVEDGGKYVILDLSACTAASGETANTIEGGGEDISTGFDIIRGNSYIKGIVLPDTLIRIGDYAFGGSESLTSVVIPSSVTSIGDSAFAYCSGLTSVTIPKGVTVIEDYTFSDCVGLTSVVIPSSVTAIGDSAFSDCGGLTSVIIPEGVTAIGDSAFSDCGGLTGVNIPSSVTAIGDSAFSGCEGLRAFTVAAGNTAYSSQNGILYNKAKTTVVSVPPTKSGALNLPNTLTRIGNEAFYGCGGLTSVIIPSGVTSIGDYAFDLCDGLTSVNIPEGVTSIGVAAFYGCGGLTSVNIAGSVTRIGNNAFASCGALTSVIFGAGSNITTAWTNYTFSTRGSSYSGTSLWNVYRSGAKPGTYTLSGATWTQTK